MQQVNLNKTIEFDSKIEDLILISIDDNIETSENKDGIKITGTIIVSGSAKTVEGNRNFAEKLELDMLTTQDDIIDKNSLKVMVDDFNYVIKDQKLEVEICLKIDGLKEIEENFLTTEDNETVFEEEIEDKRVYIEEKIEVEEKKEINIDEKDMILVQDAIEADEEINSKKSLLKSVFSNKRIKEEVFWKLHCVRGENSYEEIAVKYGINPNKLIALNKNEELKEGKLIFLPLD